MGLSFIVGEIQGKHWEKLSEQSNQCTSASVEVASPGAGAEHAGALPDSVSSLSDPMGNPGH